MSRRSGGMKDHTFEHAGEGEATSRAPGAEDPGDVPGSISGKRAVKILSKKAAKISKEDIDRLKRTLKEKVEGLKDLEDGLFWIGTLVGRVKLLWSMIRDNEFEVSLKSKLMIAAGLLYFVLPTDLTPDMIPGIGYVDDAIVLSTLWGLVQDELSEYISFLKSSGRPLDDLEELAFADHESSGDTT